MGLFKGLKEMKSMVTTAPDMLRSGMEIASSARTIQDASMAQAAAYQQTMAQPGVAAVADGDLAPIAGVDIATFGWVSKQISHHGYDQSLLAGFAAQRGIDAGSWQQAVVGWGARMTNPAIAREFRSHYDVS